MNDNGDKLRQLLKSWQNIEPSPAFESNVWRRVRQQAIARQNTPTFRHFLLEWTNLRPAYAAAAAALVGIGVGLTVATTIQSPSHDLQNNLFRPLPERSLSASYVQLVGGGKL